MRGEGGKRELDGGHRMRGGGVRALDGEGGGDCYGKQTTGLGGGAIGWRGPIG